MESRVFSVGLAFLGRLPLCPFLAVSRTIVQKLDYGARVFVVAVVIGFVPYLLLVAISSQGH